MKNLKLSIFIVFLSFLFIIEANEKQKKRSRKSNENFNKEKQQQLQTSAYFGGGCFWCVEAMFQDLKGVKDVQSGYCGGHVENPEYLQVKKGQTGHAEVIRIIYDANIISFKQLLYIFMHCHDPTTYHRQGIDSGPQYRSVVFYQTEQQLKTTKKILKQIEEDGSYTGSPQPILTEVSMFSKYYPAQQYHQDYFSTNPFDQECSAIIAPKLSKMRLLFKEYYQDGL